MAANAVEKWLEEKRRSQNRTTTASLGLAPSPMERYGFSTPAQGGVDAKGGMLPSGATMATGYGDDGKMQRTMPTQIRQTPGGNRYAVDEGEVVVVDADTVGRYGGAQALDAFVKKNAPAKPFTSPSMPYSGEGNVGHPSGGGQSQIAQQVAQQGIRQYAGGGIPSQYGLQQGGYGPAPSQPYGPTGHQPSSASPAATQASEIPDSIRNIRSAGSARLRGSTPGVPDQNTVGEMTFDPGAPVMHEIPIEQSNPAQTATVNLNPTPVQMGQADLASPVPVGSPVYKPNEIDQSILNYYSQRTGAAQEAERASEAQALRQEGLTPEAQRGIVAQSDISRRDAIANQTAQMGIGAMQKAEERRQYEQGQSLVRQQDYRAQTQFEAEQRNAAETDFTGYVQARMSADPNYDWTQDPNAVSKAQAFWDSQPGNKGKPMDSTAMTGIVKAASVTPGDTWLATQKNSQWYRDITDPVKKANVDKALTGFSGVMSMGGVTMDTDSTTGAIRFRDLTGKTMASMDPSTGNVVWGGSGGAGADGGDGYSSTFSGSITNDSDVKAYTDSFSTSFVPETTVDTASMRQYLQSHNNQGPANADDWDKWCRKDRTYDSANDDDVSTAYDIVSSDDEVKGADKDMVELYLATHDGKLGTSSEMNSYFARYGSWNDVADAISQGDSLTAAGSRLYGMAQQANKVVERYDSGAIADDEQLAQELRAAGVPSIEAARILANQYNEIITNVPQAENIDSLGTLMVGGGGDQYHFGTAYSYAWVNPSAELTQWANQNAGQYITVNGQQYIVTGDVTQTYQQVGHSEDEEDRVGVDTPAVKVFNVTSGQYEYYYPVAYNNGGNSETGTDKITLSTTEFRVGPHIDQPGV